jgi:hypothetical protein
MEIPHTTPMIKFLPQKLISAFIAIPRIAPRHPRPTQIIAQNPGICSRKNEFIPNILSASKYLSTIQLILFTFVCRL